MFKTAENYIEFGEELISFKCYDGFKSHRLFQGMNPLDNGPNGPKFDPIS